MRRAVRRFALAAVVTVAGVPLPVSAGTSTAAAVDIVQVSLASSTSTSVAKRVTVQCPAGLKVYGGGYTISPRPSGRIAVEQFEPYQDSRTGTTGFVVRGVKRPGAEASGFAWKLTAYARCGPTLSGWQLLSATAPPSSENNELRCPGAKRVAGMGIAILAGERNVSMRTLDADPDDPADPWVFTRASVDLDPGQPAPPYRIRTTAVCVNPVVAIQINHNHSVYDGRVRTVNPIGCSAGQQLLSIGFHSDVFSLTDPEAGRVLYYEAVRPLGDASAEVVVEPRTTVGQWHVFRETFCLQ